MSFLLGFFMGLYAGSTGKLQIRQPDKLLVLSVKRLLLVPKNQRNKNKGARKGETAVLRKELDLSRYVRRMWPAELFVRMVYSDYRILTASTNEAEYVYRINSLYDPDVTGVGGQPDGFDEVNDLYSRYTVLAAKWTVSAFSNAAAGRAKLVAVPSISTSPIGLTDEAAGLPDARACICSFAGSPARVSHKLGIGQVAGVSQEQISIDSAFSAAVTASPSRDIALHILCETSGATDTVGVDVEIEYWARFSAPNTIIDAARSRRIRLRRAHELAVMNGQGLQQFDQLRQDSRHLPAVAEAAELPPRPALSLETKSLAPTVGGCLCNHCGTR